MSDLISRQAAIEKISETIWDTAVANDVKTTLKELPSTDEQAIVTEYCRKRNLVIITMEFFRVLQAYYNKQNGMDGEQND